MKPSLSLGQAPHILHDIFVCLSVCKSGWLSVHTLITQQFINVVLIYGVSSIVGCSFEDMACVLFYIQQTLHDKRGD